MTQPDPHTAPPTRPKPRRVGRLVAGTLALLSLACAGLFFSVAWPNYKNLALRAKSAEVAANVAAIRQAELAHMEHQGSPLAAGPAPVPVEALGRLPQDWTPGTAFDSLGWAPEGQVRGTYEVRLTEGGPDFVVHGWIDTDGDGVPVHFTATRDTEATRLTPSSVF